MKPSASLSELVRVRAVGKFLAVGYTIAVAVGLGGVRACGLFLRVGKSVVVRVVGRVTKIPSSERPRPSESRRRLKDQCVQSTLRRR